MIRASLLVTLVLSATLASAQTRPTATAVRTDTPPSIDGVLDDAVWATAPIATDFTQRDPNDGSPASERTEVRVLYDDNAVYVGARMYTSEPPSSQLGRRDMSLDASDWFRVAFDTFHDKLNAFRFDVNPSGVRRDATISGNYFGRGGGGGGGGRGGGRGGGGGGGGNAISGSNGELGWDPVWGARTTIDAEGWTAELRIPLSQLRYTPGDSDWGVQFERIDYRRQELSQFAPIPRTVSTGVAEFAVMDGLVNLERGQPIEFIPYVLVEGLFDSTDSNPLVPSSDSEFKVGGDARYGITPNLTLTATINPDFGQVEVDPAEINLSQFETVLQERRPFFIEGASAYDFAPRSMGPSSAAGLLYTRRIGRSPQVRLPGNPSHSPSAVDILGAAKLTGRTASGWTMGLLSAFTDEARGVYLDASNNRIDGIVEPLTNYSLVRVNREMRGGQAAVGGIITAVNRDTGDPAVDSTLVESAYTGGIDFNSEFANRSWNVAGFIAGSVVEGSTDAISRVQLSPSRSYQRPDATSFSFDPTRTSLSGAAGQLQVTKTAGEHWTGDIGVSFISPGYEINDLGRQQNVDRKSVFGRIGYNERVPGPVLRNWNVGINPQVQYNYDGDELQKSVMLNGGFQHASYWQMNVQAGFNASSLDDRFTRGGPVAGDPQGWNASIRANSDPRQPITLNANVSRRMDKGGGRSDSIGGGIEIRTGGNFSFSLDPDYTRSTTSAQYVAAINDSTATATYGRRYVFAPLERTEFGLNARVNYSFSPELSLEFYSQALVSSGRYGTPKEFLEPRQFKFATYGTDLGTLSESGGVYTIDPDGAGPAASFTVSDRSFNQRTLTANAVLRWEFLPGSTMFVVWQQARDNRALMDRFSVARATGSLLDAEPTNVLAIKVSYWFSP